MVTNNRLLSFYTLSLKLKLVCHLLFNGHETFSQASLVILVQKRVFQFLITPSGFEQCIDKANVFRDRFRQSGKLLFISTQFNT